MKASITSLLLSTAFIPLALGAAIPPTEQQNKPLLPGVLSTVTGLLNKEGTTSTPQTETTPGIKIGLTKKDENDLPNLVDVEVDLGDSLTKKSDPKNSDKIDLPGISISTSDGEEGSRVELNVEDTDEKRSENPNEESDVATINIGTGKETRSEEHQETEGKRCKPAPFRICQHHGHD